MQLWFQSIICFCTNRLFKAALKPRVNSLFFLATYERFKLAPLKRTSGRVAAEPRRVSRGFRAARVQKRRTFPGLANEKAVLFQSAPKLTQNTNKDENKAWIQAQIRLIIRFQMKKSHSLPLLRQACSILEGFSPLHHHSPPPYPTMSGLIRGQRNTLHSSGVSGVSLWLLLEFI